MGVVAAPALFYDKNALAFDKLPSLGKVGNLKVEV